MSRSIGDAWVAVKASGETFGADVSRIIKAGTAGLKADIPVTADTKRAVTDIDGLKVKIADITARAKVFKLDADDKTAQAKLLDIQSRLDKYGKRIDTAKADLDIRPLLASVIRADAALDALGKKKVTPKADAGGGAGGGSFSLAGAAAVLTPALATTGAVGLGAAAGLAGAFVAAAGAVGAFGAVAKPVLSGAETASKAVETAQIAYTAAIDTGTKKSTAYAAEQKAIAKAYGDMSPAQIALSKQLGTMADAWDAVKAKSTPVVAGAITPWLKSVTDLTGKLGPIIAAVAPVIGGLGSAMDGLINSSAFTKFRDFVAGTGSAAAGAIGKDVIDFFRAVITILPQFNPLIQDATGWLGKLGPALDNWASSKHTADDITKFMQWFHDNGPAVGALLTNVAGALAKLAPGLGAGGSLELQLISDFMGAIAKLPPDVASSVATGIVGIVSAVKLWSAAQKILDAELLANPIGLVVIAVAALGIAFYEAWTKSAGFRDFIKSIGASVVQMGILTLQGLKQITDGFDNFVSAILDGAVKAFGWVPGLGPKLKTAAKNFDDFKDSTDDSYDKMISKLQAWQNELTNNASTSKATAAKIVADFTNQGKAATVAQDDLSNYSAAIKGNGVNSDAAKAARQQLIKDLTNAGVNSKTANTDVTNYTTAVKQNGINSDAAKKARQQLVTDILDASKNSVTGKTDVGNLTTAIELHGKTSDQYKSARAQLITDLEKAGVNAKTATGLVDTLSQSISKIPGSKSVTLFMTGDGKYSIGQTRTITSTGQVNTLGGHTKALGGLINMGTGPTADDVPAMLSRGELVVPANMVAAGAVDHLRGLLPGFAAGGVVQQGNSAVLNGSAPGTDYSNFQTTVTNSLVAAMRASIKAAAAAAASAEGAYLGAGSGNYSADISAVLKSMGLPASLLSNWLRQIATESGGNLGAVNRTDSNAAAGHPSVGLLQIIPGTFAAYAGPYRNTPPLVNYGGGTVSENAMAQIYAAIHYAAAAYGGAAMGSVIGQGHGYATGTNSAVPGWAMVGENGPEIVRFGGGESVTPVKAGGRAYATTPGHAAPMSEGDAAILAELRGIRAAVGTQGGSFAAALNGSAGGAAMRGRYSTRRT